MQYIGRGSVIAQRQLPIDYPRLIACGLGIATLTGIGSWALGAPFLTSWHATPVLPWIGPVPLATASIFDLGVYLTVVGATLLTLVTLDRVAAVTPDRVGAR